MTLSTILNIHNFYQHAGGEDQAYYSDTQLLESHGHSVVHYEDSNHRIKNNLVTAIGTVWNHSAYRNLYTLVESRKPQVAHFHNTFPLISPAALYAVRAAGIPIVQELHNFRLLCPGALLSRNGHVCEECIDQDSFFPALKHRCYRDSLPATAAVVTMLGVHHAVGTWDRLVDVFLAPSAFLRDKFIDNGISGDRIILKPSLVLPEPTAGTGRGNFALFVGRLSEEKGVESLAEAWKMLPDIPLMVAGDGPLANLDWPSSVTRLGRQSRERVMELMKDAAVLVHPSTCYEGGSRTILEAYGNGLPVIASEIGSNAERVAHGRTGLSFRPGDPQDLAQKVRWAFDHPDELADMRLAARREYEEKYTAERNYEILIQAYSLAMDHARSRLTKEPVHAH